MSEQKIKLDPFDSPLVEHGYGKRFQGFQHLMRHRIRDILLVSSLYDLYVFEEDGRLYELIRDEYQGLNLSHVPEITRVSRGEVALALANEEKRFDLIITTPHIEDMDSTELARQIRESGLKIPVVLLAYDNRELAELLNHADSKVFDRIFIWTGNFRIIVAIVKHLEDIMNVEQDTRLVGVQSIILIEDNVRFYSSFLPLLYTEILKQSQRLILEGINLTHKYLRMRARPKILLCTNYEEAWSYFEKYQDTILGVISDIDFKKGGKHDPRAGIKFAREVKKRHDDIPILLQSNRSDFEKEARKIGAHFVLKDSPTLLQELRQFTISQFGFGDFIFRTPDGVEVARATDLISLEEQLKRIPEDSIRFHAERNHFSTWLKARTEFWLAHKLRPRKVADYPSLEALRQHLIKSLREYRKIRQQGIITDFKKESFDIQSGFARLGGGSLGGKARGLSFVNTLITNYNIINRFPGTRIMVPPAVVLGTDVFDTFLDENNLRQFALSSDDDVEITRRFLAATRFPSDIIAELVSFLDLIKTPLAVRSSSLLEDSQYHPFAGVYQTYMIANNHENPLIRLNELLNAIKRVYASTFYKAAKQYINVTSYRLEEEKMAVIIQKMVGSKHKNRFYPTFSGVAKSYNFYPTPPQKPEDGIVSVALGLGKMIVDGGNTLKFSPKYPNHIAQLFSTKEFLRTSQHKFYALDFTKHQSEDLRPFDEAVRLFSLKDAEEDGTLYYVGSTYLPQEDRVVDGLSRSGGRVINFAPILKHKVFPLSQISILLLEMGSWGMGTPVEIEFAVDMTATNTDGLKEFGVLQMRPLVLKRELEQINIEDYHKENLICYSPSVLGHGVIKDIYDIVYVDYHKFNRAKSRQVADEVNRLNALLVKENKPYLLIGVGRWGSLDPWLGIPVNWEQISGAKAIVETSFKDFMVAPSQGSHFFQNLTSFMVGYFTVNQFKSQGFVDWNWLKKQPLVTSFDYTFHIRLDKPIKILMNGRKNQGIITKP
ncbi:MAG: histidine kinase [Calditrichaeota bacterium]|nr:histidine kinase [Calditrichota bacterium]